MVLSVEARLCFLQDCEMSGSVVSAHLCGLTCSYSARLNDQNLSADVADDGMLQ